MRRSVLWGVAAAAAAGFCVDSFAQTVRVQYWAQGSDPVFSRDYPSGASIADLPAFPAALTRINIYSVDGPANIGSLVLVDSPGPVGTSEIDVVLGQGAPTTDGPLTPAGINFGGINAGSATAGRLRLGGAISGDVNGRIVCARVTRLEVGGSLGGEVIASGAGEAVGLIRAGRIGAVTGVTPGKRSAAAALGIVASQGSINSVLVANAIDIPSPGTISAQRGIADVTARSVKATIIANAFSGDGNLEHLWCTGGDYEGTVVANNLGTPGGLMPGTMIYVAGVLRGMVQLAGNLYGGVCAEQADPVTGLSIGGVKVDGNFLGLIDGPGDIGRVEILRDIQLDTNSYVLPGIRSRYGTIALLQVNGAVRGELDLWPVIQAAHINTLRIGGDAAANFSAWPAGFVEIKHVDIGGSLTGAMSISDFVTFNIRGDVAAGAQVWREGPLPPEDTMVIGRALRGSILIDGPVGLLGQVVLNANLDPVGGWGLSGVIGLRPQSGPVQFMTLPDYERAGAAFGSGAVGAAPYTLRPRECAPSPLSTSPEIDQAVWPDGEARETIRVTLDGPVAAADELPITIERARYASSCGPGESCHPRFEDVTKEFLVLVAPPGRPREIWISPLLVEDGGTGTFSGGWLYQVTPRRENGVSMLRSLGTNLALAPGVASFVYRAAVDSFDLNSDGATDEIDLACWSKQPRDFNADAQVDVLDLQLIERAVELHRR